MVRQWLYEDQLNPVAELDGTGNVLWHYVYASREHSPDFLVSDAGAVYRVISDQLGSPRLIVNIANSADVLLEAEYTAFGARTVVSGDPSGVTVGFAGGVLDVDTGLTRFGARDYDPVVGRWVTRDPIGFGGGQANVYQYVRNDPVNRVDRTGLRDLPGTWDNGVVTNNTNRTVLVTSDTQGTKALAPGETTDVATDTDFIIDGHSKTKVGPNSVTVQPDGSVTQDGWDLPGGWDDVRPYDPKIDGPLPDHHPDPWGRPMCSALY